MSYEVRGVGSGEVTCLCQRKLHVMSTSQDNPDTCKQCGRKYFLKMVLHAIEILED